MSKQAHASLCVGRYSPQISLPIAFIAPANHFKTNEVFSTLIQVFGRFERQYPYFVSSDLNEQSLLLIVHL